MLQARVAERLPALSPPLQLRSSPPPVDLCSWTSSTFCFPRRPVRLPPQQRPHFPREQSPSSTWLIRRRRLFQGTLSGDFNVHFPKPSAGLRARVVPAPFAICTHYSSVVFGGTSYDRDSAKRLPHSVSLLPSWTDVGGCFPGFVIAATRP